tara:strand:+ start:135 stop:1505 length:1371 start_codon:yes stop_codon:yes gene_type:complete
MDSKQREIEELIDKLTVVFKSQIKELLSKFSSSSTKFLDFELNLHKKLSEIGRATLEDAIPYLYGNGYVGPTFTSEEGDVYGCYEKTKIRTLKTIFGKVSFERSRYYNEELGLTRSVTDIHMDIEGKKYCPLLRYWSCLLGTVCPFDEGSDIMHKLTGASVSASDVRNITEGIAKKIAKEHDKAILRVKLDEEDKVEPAKITVNKNSENIIYFETDGCHVPTLDAWKECKTLLLFEMKKEGEKNILLNKHYFSSLRDIKYFKRQVKKQLENYCKRKEVNIVCIGDGADWIWNMVHELVPEGVTEILDWYHIEEKIWELANELYLEDKVKIKSFVDEQLEWLKKGNTGILIQNLCKLKNKEKNKLKFELIDRLLKYIENNKERMKYDLYKKEGHCIGSGAIESANKYVIQRRLKLPGIRWEPENAEYMAHLRAEYINRKLEGFLGINYNPLLEIAET